MIPAIGEQFDLFTWYRWLFAIVVSTYTILIMARAARHVISFASGKERYRVVLIRFVTVQLLRLRIRRFVSELSQITALLVLLVVVLWLHHRLGYV